MAPLVSPQRVRLETFQAPQGQGLPPLCFHRPAVFVYDPFTRSHFFSSGAVKMQIGPDQGALPNSLLAQERLLSA